MDIARLSREIIDLWLASSAEERNSIRQELAEKVRADPALMDRLRHTVQLEQSDPLGVSLIEDLEKELAENSALADDLNNLLPDARLPYEHYSEGYMWGDPMAEAIKTRRKDGKSVPLFDLLSNSDGRHDR
ncbi:MAG TPA: hypothetical protein VNO14_01395 [Blastocatellia bacterium]|nr:hypothetical protein [Blastocatellia bacterium]